MALVQPERPDSAQNPASGGHIAAPDPAPSESGMGLEATLPSVPQRTAMPEQPGPLDEPSGAFASAVGAAAGLPGDPLPTDPAALPENDLDRRFEHVLETVRAQPPARRPRPDPRRLDVLPGAARRPAPRLRRALRRPSARSRAGPRRAQDGRDRHRRRPAARRRRRYRRLHRRRSHAASASRSRTSSKASPSSTKSSSPTAKTTRPKTSARCCSPWSPTFAWSSSSSPTACTTCARSST